MVCLFDVFEHIVVVGPEKTNSEEASDIAQVGRPILEDRLQERYMRIECWDMNIENEQCNSHSDYPIAEGFEPPRFALVDQRIIFCTHPALLSCPLNSILYLSLLLYLSW